MQKFICFGIRAKIPQSIEITAFLGCRLRFRACRWRFREHMPRTRFAIMLFHRCSSPEPLEITRFNALRAFR